MVFGPRKRVPATSTRDPVSAALDAPSHSRKASTLVRGSRKRVPAAYTLDLGSAALDAPRVYTKSKSQAVKDRRALTFTPRAFTQDFGCQCKDIFTPEERRTPPGPDGHLTFIDFVDVIEVQLRKELKELRLRQLKYFKADVAISAATNTPVLMNDNHYTNPKFFKIFEGLDDAHLLPVRLFELGPTAFVEVRVQCKWQRLPAFLDTLRCRIYNYKDQSNYWAHIQAEKSSFFNIKGLPLELRRTIYRHAMFADENYDLYPYRYAEERDRWFKGDHGNEGRSPCNINLLNVDPQIYQEASEEMFEVARFNFDAAWDFTNFLRVISIPSKTQKIRGVKLLHNIRRIHLQAHFHELQLLVPMPKEDEHQDAGLAFMKLLDLTKFNSLSIKIPGPSALYHYDWIGKRGEHDYGCHTKVVQWVLELMTPFISHLGAHQLRLDGLLKQPQKVRFLQYLRDVQNGKVKATIANHEEYGPFLCTCIHPCNDRDMNDCFFEHNCLNDDDEKLPDLRAWEVI